VVVDVGLTLILEPVPIGGPDVQAPSYQTHSALNPNKPPTTASVDDEPGHIFKGEEIAVEAAIELALIVKLAASENATGLQVPETLALNKFPEKLKEGLFKVSVLVFTPENTPELFKSSKVAPPFTLICH
jgi:hypothetical protein